MGQSRLAVIRPKWVVCNVHHDHLFSAECGCPARTCSRPDHNSIDGISVSLWKAGSTAMPQAIPINQQDRRQGVPDLFLYETAHAVKYLRKRVPFGHHLENPLLSSE